VNSFTTPSTLRNIVAACGLFACASAHAQISNGDFSAGLASWTPIGDVSDVVGTAFITNAFSDGTDDATNFNLSASSPFEANIVGGLEESTGLVNTDLDLSPSTTAAEGSAISQTFSFTPGLTQLNFSYNFFTNEGTNLDYAYVAINGTVVAFAEVADASTASGTYAFETGVQNATVEFISTGTVTLSFGVVDISDFFVSSAVSIDNVSLTAIPEPSTFAALAGSLALGLVALRRRRAA
jgi:PEP-CTERM motif